MKNVLFSLQFLSYYHTVNIQKYRYNRKNHLYKLIVIKNKLTIKIVKTLAKKRKQRCKGIKKNNIF